MKKILILSGPTHEYIDAVRYITNASSGKLGKEIANESINRNYYVDFITGPIHKENYPSSSNNLNIYSVITAMDMYKKALELFIDANVIIFVAAVSDFTSKDKLKNKIDSQNHQISINLEPTIDIAKEIGKNKKKNQKTIGFSLQVNGNLDIAMKKLKSKNLDTIILNNPINIGSEFGSFEFINKNKDHIIKTGTLSKTECASLILDNLINNIGKD